MGFVELSDGTLLNLSSIREIKPKEQGNRIDFISGGHRTLIDIDAEVIRAALTAKPTKTRRNLQKTGGAMK